MKKLRLGLVLVAVLQIIPIIIMPINTLKNLDAAIWAALIALFGLLGVMLLLRRGASRVATIFVQGFNILVRVLLALGNVMRPDGGGLNVELVVTFVVSMLLSGLILYYVDQPDVQLQMQF